MAQFPCFPLWTDAYLADTGHLTTLEHGAYLLLLMAMWRTSAKSLPNDDIKLARFARLTPGQWKRIRPTLIGFFDVDGDQLRQGRLTDEANAVRQLSESQSRKSKARWLKNKKGGDAVGFSGLSRSDPSPTPTPINKQKTRETPETKPRRRPTLDAAMARSSAKFLERISANQKPNGSAKKPYPESLGAIIGGVRDRPTNGADYDDPEVRKARWRQKLHNYLIQTLGLESKFVGELWERYDAGETDARNGIQAFAADMKAEEETIRARGAT